MKNILFTILFIYFTSLSFGQMYEVGGFVGGSNFIGDIGRTNYIFPNAFSGGLVFKYNRNPRIALRLNYTYIGLKGNDADSDNAFRKQRNVSFSNNAHEFALGTEINFWEYNIKVHENAYTPYILTQVGFFNYNTPKSLENNKLRMQNSLGFTIPVGVGFKGRINDNFAFAIESGVRFTFKDDLDYTSPHISRLNFGGQGDDHYLFTGFSVVYTFGRPPCYADMR